MQLTMTQHAIPGTDRGRKMTDVFNRRAVPAREVKQSFKSVFF